MTKQNIKQPSSYWLPFISPWLLAAAIAILLLIIIIFAVSNIRREKEHLTQSLFHKGQAIIRFMGAGTRSAFMMGSQGPSQLQQLIEQAAGEAGIKFIAVLDQDGRIMAHSDPDKINSNSDYDLDRIKQHGQSGTWRIIENHDREGNVFEVSSMFQPFRPGKRHFRRHMEGMMGRGPAVPPPGEIRPWQDKDNFGKPCPPGTMETWCRLLGLPPDARPDSGSSFIIVGLDMKELEEAIGQNRFQITFLSIALLLVGIGGWISLLTAQGYKISQATLDRMEVFTSLLISRLPVGIIATDGSGRIKTFNEVAANLTGVAAQQALNQSPEAVLPDPLRPCFLEARDIKGKEYEVRLHEERMVQLRMVPVVDRQNTPLGMVLLMHDLTEIKKLEGELRRHDRLAALGKMAAGVAHEVRNPLSSIKGFATLLGSKFSRESEEKKVARLLVNEVERLNRSISELLNFAKPLPLHPSRIEVHKLLADSLRLIDTDAAALNITVRLQMESMLPDLYADLDKINQMLLNLYLNALQAMPNGGELEVSAETADQSGMITLAIRDNGCGMDDDMLERVFDPYFTTKPGGTGLGLAMVQKIVEEHGGTIRFESQAGKGTTVILILPVAV